MYQFSTAHYDTTVEEKLGGWMWAYQAFTVTWLVFGLGYIFMIVTVIADNLRKPARKAVKKFRVAEQKVLSNKILQELLDMKEQDRWAGGRQSISPTQFI